MHSIVRGMPRAWFVITVLEFGMKRKTPTLLWRLAEESCQALAREASRIFLPGHGKKRPHPRCSTISRRILLGVGKGGDPNILTRPWQQRRTEDFNKAPAREATMMSFQHCWAAPQLPGTNQRRFWHLSSLFNGSVKRFYPFIQSFRLLSFHSLLLIYLTLFWYLFKTV
jgi:hypothetical protein